MGLNSAHANMQEINLTGQVSCAGTGAATHHFFFKAALFSNIAVKGRIGFQVSAGAFFKGAVVIADCHDIVRAIFLADGEKAVQKAFDFLLLVGKQQEQAEKGRKRPRRSLDRGGR